jgi:hypothetical protein
MHHVLRVVLCEPVGQIRSAPMGRYRPILCLIFWRWKVRLPEKFGLSMQFSENPHTFGHLFA